MKSEPTFDEYPDESSEENSNSSEVTAKTAPELHDAEGFFGSIWSKVKDFVDDLLGDSSNLVNQKPVNDTNSTTTTSAPKANKSTTELPDDEEIIQKAPKKSTTLEPDEEETESKDDEEEE